MCLTIGSKISLDSLRLKDETPKTPEAKSDTLTTPAVKTYNDDKINVSQNSKSRFTQNENLQAVMDGRTYITKGMSGDGVKLVQEALKDLGFYPGDKADGKFGNQTTIAIKNFQDNRGLKQTGVIDKTTLNELNKVAPPPGKKIWDKGVIEGIFEETKDTKIAPSNVVGENKRAKIVVDLSEHRLFLYNDDNSVKKVYSVASGKGGWADGRGNKTKTGTKIINYKMADPTSVANQLWPETKGKAFGTKLLDLQFIDLKTGKKTLSGEELHGTYTRNSIGTDASHGCMRMQNEDIEEVFKAVKQGDLVQIQD